MSRVYNVPADVREKEKIIGGLLTLGQFLWIAGGFLLGLAALAGIYMTTKTFAIAAPVGIMFATTGLPFAFYKKNGVELPIYIVRKIKFNRKQQKLINKRNLNNF
jgi:hypothetical protein